MEDHPSSGDTLVEERQVAIYSPSDINPTLRKAHFLKPLFSEHDDHFPPPPSSLFSSKPTLKKLERFDLHHYKKYPSEKWKTWVDSLKPKYQEVWKQAGVYEAIMASTYKIRKHKELILGLAERWCAETNTLIFPWGEVTITLEDVMFLGGYSVLGALYLTPLADGCVGIFDSLKKAYNEVRLISGGKVIDTMWMEYFMCSGKELEHEAFLAMWLSRFVLVHSYGNIVVHDFHVAIHLSRGKRIALAPVVLASIYRDMRLLRSLIDDSDKLQSRACLKFILCHADLVHMWAWERFPKLRPTPCVIESEDPRAARWNGVRIPKGRDVREALDFGKDSFIWRPYVITLSNCILSKLYGDNEQMLVVESNDTESLARCLSVSELVGLDYIEQYLPHRVARQFGLDQDVPPHVMRSNESPKTAWSTYKRSTRGKQLYIPPRHFQSNVSSRYMVWWMGLLPVNEETVTTCIQYENHLPLISWGHKRRRTRRMESFGKRNNLHDMMVIKTHIVSKPSTERPIILKEDAVVNDTNHVEVNDAIAKHAKDEVVSKSDCSVNNIADIEETRCDHTSSEMRHLGLIARIWRLEKIVNVIKAAKPNASSSGTLDSSSY